MNALLAIIGLIVFLIIVWLLFHRRTISSLELKTLLISLPRNGQGEKGGIEDWLQEINLSEQLFNALTAIKKPFAFEASVHESGGDIFFYLAVPRSVLDFTTRQIQGFFPKARVELAPDYTIFSSRSATAGAYAVAEKGQALPLRTYQEAKADLFAPILSTLSKLKEEGDGAAWQIMLKPAESKVKNKISQAIGRLKKGETFGAVMAKDSLLKDLNKIFKLSSPAANKNKGPVVVDEEMVKTLTQKIAKPLFWVNARIVTAAETVGRADDLLLSAAGSLSQFAAPLRNNLKIIKPTNPKKIVWDFIFREFRPAQAILLNTEELASLFHLPAGSTDVPRIKWLNTKEAPPPDVLPKDGVIIGVNIFRGDRTIVRLADDDRRRHFYLIGQTGTGKSYLMLNMIAQDLAAGRGLAVIDPHGELVDAVLGLMPKDRIDDCIIFNPGDLSRPLGLNMLEHNLARPEEKTFIVGEIQSIFNRLFDKETMGPMFEQYMRNALLLLMEDMKHEPATLMEVPRIFTDENFRKGKLSRIANPTVIDFWEKEATKTTGEQGLANITPYITSKFGNFIANDYMRPIIGQPQSAFNFRSVMDNQKILLVNLAKGRIGDINAGLLGMIFTGRLLLAALSRTDLAEAARPDFYLYIDEFQNFTTDSISVILSEARKYRLNLILAHQFIAQLTDQIREAVFGNVGSLASFRVGASDAEELVKHFKERFSERDLMTIENQNAIVRLLINGEPSVPFNLKTLKAPAGSTELRNKLKELSRLSYGRDLSEVERDIMARLRQ